MRARFLPLGIGVWLGALGLAGEPAGASDAADSPVERLHLSCLGTMIADKDTPPSKIMADGTVDLVARRVRGFGLGSAPIVVLTAARIAFGAAPGRGAGASSLIEGTIDRMTGDTHILVHAHGHADIILIEMTLTCHIDPAVS